MDERQVVLHKGIYKQVSNVPEAIFMITGMTIGAGVLGLPYVISQIGLKIGLVYILVLGLVMLFLNLMVGEIAVRTNEPLQLAGFAGKYLGGWAKTLLSITILSSSVGVLLAYIVGEGDTISSLFHISPLAGSLIFWFIGSAMIWRGLQTIKVAEKFLGILVMGIIAGLSFYLLPKFQFVHWGFSDVTKIFLPFGVILFALHATPAIVEAHAILPGSQRHYRRAVIVGTLIPIILYMLFALAVVGATGANTTQIATIGLGQKFGGWVLTMGNLFAMLAMGTAFMGMGIALKQTLMWDHKLGQRAANLLVIGVPLLLFLLGLTNFIAILDLVGGLFIGIEAIIVALICIKARQKSDIIPSRYDFRLFWVFLVPVLIILSLATVYSVIKILHY